MKIVLNKSYGGFGLSHEAKMMLFKKIGVEVFPYINKWSKDEISYEKFLPKKLENSPLIGITYFLKDPQLDKFTEGLSEKSKYEPRCFDFDDKRSNKELVEVVETLGNKANTLFSDLEIVKIPDGVSYEISNYSGIETAYYVGRA